METKKLTHSDLAGFYGTDHYYKYNGIMLTDGVKFLAERAQCYWLLDVVISVQIAKQIVKHRKVDRFQSIKLVVKNDRGIFTVDDGNKNILYRQVIEYTDFPLDEIKMYLIDDVLMLTSEY